MKNNTSRIHVDQLVSKLYGPTEHDTEVALIKCCIGLHQGSLGEERSLLKSSCQYQPRLNLISKFL
jgi:hypothetical protein